MALARMAEKFEYEVPQLKLERDLLRAKLRAFAEASGLVAPLTLDELRGAVEEFLAGENSECARYRDWLCVILNNEVWRGEFEKIPHASRVLLLPQCLRNRKSCKATFDKFGLLCAMCGACKIDELQSFADTLDCVSLVSDSTTMVERLVEEGKVSALVGVSCMASLEKSFPRVLKKGIASIAIPLLRGGCADTDADSDWVREALAAHKKGFVAPENAFVKEKVFEIFKRENIEKYIPLNGECAGDAVGYLCEGGNRWRPRILASAFFAMSETCELSDDALRAAIAVECFHKASLIHDDIEDGDDFRDGFPSLHGRVGLERAVNAGDFLLGAGYNILSACKNCAKLIAEASRAHLILCSGQGEEMRILRESSGQFGLSDCLGVYEKKTAAAFAAALNMAAICAGRFSELGEILEDFSKNFGISYQLYDDLRDEGRERRDALQNLIKANLKRENLSFEGLYSTYRLKTYESLKNLRDAPLKRLLFSVAGLVLKDV